MKKTLTLILSFCLLICPLGISAATPEIKTAYAQAKLLNYGEFPEYPEPNVQTAAASIPQYNSAAGVAAYNTDERKEIHEYLRDSIINCESEINLIDYEISVNPNAQANDPPDKLNIIFTETTNYYPELFNISNKYSFRYYSTKTGNFAYSLIPKYVDPNNRSQVYSNQEAAKSAYDAALEIYNNKIDFIINGITPEMSDLERALYVHDYFATHFRYDTASTKYDAYSFFVTNEGVCQAYTQAYNAIMHRLGIKCTSAIDNKDKHTWNVITLNGKNYHIDVTQDDPVGQSAGYAKHTYFLLSDQTISTIDDKLYVDPENPENLEKDINSHEAWYTAMYDASCTDTNYESGYAWNEADSSFEYADGYWYYIKFGDNSTSRIFRTRDFINSVAVSDAFNTRFPVPDNPDCYFTNFGSISSVGNILYCSAPDKIYYYNSANGTNGKINVTIPSEALITSCRYDGNGVLTVFFGSSPNSYDNGGHTEVTLFKMGNADGSKDGKIDAVDITYTKQYLLGTKTDFNWATIDFGNKKHVNILDLIKIKKLAAVA